MRLIDEAIVHERDIAAIQRNNDKLNKTLGANSPYYKTDCLECAEEHEQLAEWLEELKKYREIGTIEECKNSVLDIMKAYNKAIDEYKDKLCTFCKFRQIETKGYHEYPQCMIGGCHNIIIGEQLKGCHILAIAEQLKAGGENER